MLAAVLVFWTVGAYNRLVGLRSAILAAWARVDETLRSRGATVAPLVAALREPLVAEQGALDTLLGAHGRAEGAAASLRARPTAAASAAVWAMAETQLASAASRVLALMEQDFELRADTAIVPLVSIWRESEAQLGFARQLFDGAVQEYNEALAQFPTRLLARLFGFKPAGRLGA